MKHLMQQPIIVVDNTTLKVVEPVKINSYVWLSASGADSPTANILNTETSKIVQYDYDNSGLLNAR